MTVFENNPKRSANLTTTSLHCGRTRVRTRVQLPRTEAMTTGSFFPQPVYWHFFFFNGGGTSAWTWGLEPALPVLHKLQLSAAVIGGPASSRCATGNNTLSEPSPYPRGEYFCHWRSCGCKTQWSAVDIGLGASTFRGFYGNLADSQIFCTTATFVEC